MQSDDAAVIAEQIAYYRARAPEYDRVYAERADMRALLTAVADLPITGDVLELACGTGQWTPRLAARARSVTALDASPETLAIARARVTAPTVTFVQTDIFTWQPQRRYDTVFFAFWLSHVPASRTPGFWHTVATALAPHGKAVFIDEGPEAARDDPAPEVRTLDDGSLYNIVKVFHDPDALTADLAALGWSADIRSQGDFILGVADPPTTH